MSNKSFGNWRDHFNLLKKDVKKHCHTLVTKTLTQLDIVSREEFDAQTKVLLRTRKKLEALEAQLDKLKNLRK